MSYTYEYPRPSITVDITVAYKNQFLLVQRKNEPYKGSWVFPGGFVNIDERIVDAARRELKEETSLDLVDYKFEPIEVFDEIDRDPRGRTISFLFLCRLPQHLEFEAKAADDAANCMWYHIDDIYDNIDKIEFGFDHKTMFKILYYNYFLGR